MGQRYKWPDNAENLGHDINFLNYSLQFCSALVGNSRVKIVLVRGYLTHFLKNQVFGAAVLYLK